MKYKNANVTHYTQGNKYNLTYIELKPDAAVLRDCYVAALELEPETKAKQTRLWRSRQLLLGALRLDCGQSCPLAVCVQVPQALRLSRGEAVSWKPPEGEETGTVRGQSWRASPGGLGKRFVLGLGLCFITFIAVILLLLLFLFLLLRKHLQILTR